MEDKNLKRRKRLIYNKINKALNQYRCLFLTITFNDLTLKRTNEETRERYIKKYLSNETAFYIANRDYGEENGREHYHAFIIASTLKKEDFNYRSSELEQHKNKINLKAWTYGSIRADFISTRFVIKGDKNYKLASKKITEHFFKATTQNSRIIQSRNIPSKKEQKERIYRLLKTLENTPSAKFKKLNERQHQKEIFDEMREIERQKSNESKIDFNKLIDDLLPKA